MAPLFDFSNADVRESSFFNDDRTRKLPHEYGMMHITVLVLNGFYLVGQVGDAVKCFMCGVILHGLPPGISIGFAHLFNSPHCKHAWIVTPIQRIQEISEIIPHKKEDDSYYQIPFTVHNPEYAHYQARLYSFQGHYHHFLNQSPESLAEAGFFYTGESDTVTCHACDGQLKKWDPGDMPWIEHVLWFPGCKYCIQKKGAEFIKRFIRATSNTPVINQGNRVPGGPIHSISSLAAKACLQHGFSKAEVSKAVQCCERKGLVITEHILSLILLLEFKNRDFPIRSIAMGVERQMTEDEDVSSFNGLRRGHTART